MFRFLFLLLAISFPLLATDCDTDCEKHFDGYFQGYDLYRCQVEREIACKTGLTNCDTFRLPPFDVGYRAAIKTVDTSNREIGWPKNATHCHERVTAAFELYSGVSNAVGAYKFAVAVYEGTKAAFATSAVASAWVGVAIEGAKAMSHCACKHATYQKTDGTQADGNPHDLWGVSMVGGGGWAERWGKNETASRNENFNKVFQAVGPQIKKQVNSTFGSHQRNVAEVICREGTYWATDTGGAAMTTAFNTVKERGWKDCLFRISALPTGDPQVSDWYFASVRKGKRWYFRTGPVELRDQVVQEAIFKVGGSFDEKKEGRFSIHRATRTQAACSKDPVVDGGLSTQDEIVMLTAGHGYDSFSRAHQLLRSKHPGFHSCVFDVADYDFGPLVPNNFPVAPFKTVNVTFRNSTNGTVAFRLNGGNGLNTSLGAGQTQVFNVVVDKGILPLVQITQSNGQKLNFTLLGGGSYQFINRNGKIENAFF